MKVPYINRGKNIASIGGVRVYPGETRMVDQRDHPDHKPAKPAEREPRKHSHPALELLDSPVGQIVPQLPQLTGEEFLLVQQAERDGNKTRKSLIKAFDEEHIRRAAVAEAAGIDYDEFLTDLLRAEGETLAAALKAEQEDDKRQPLIEAYEAEIARRADEANPEED